MKKYYFLSTLVAMLLFGGTLFSTTAIGADKAETLTLKLAHYVPSGSFLGQQTQWWADEVEKRTAGKVKIRIFWMQSLVKMPDMLKAIQSGIADIGWIPSTYWPSNFPLYMMMDNLGNCLGDYSALILAGDDTIDNEPHLKAELERENVFPIIPYISGVGKIGFKKCPDSFLNLKGKTIRVYGGSQTKYVENLGASPIFMPYSDIYEAIDRGTIDGVIMVVALSDGFKHYEVVKCLPAADIGSAVACGFAMNRAAFFKLTQDVQKLFLDLRREYGLRYAKALKELEDSLYAKWASQYGVTLKDLTPEEKKFNQKAIEDSTRDIIKEQEAKGIKGSQAVWDYFMASQKRIKAERAK